MAPLWWKSGMPAAGCTAAGRVSSARAAVRCRRLAALELVHEAEGSRVDLDELDPDVGGDGVHLRGPDDPADGHHRVFTEVERDAQDVSERDLAADRLETDPALRDVAAHAEQVAGVHRCERD